MTVLLGGRYAIERRIGEGGMAEVLLARDQQRNGAPVVVKRCRAHLAHQPEFAHLFLREARLASLIHHPNVVELEATGDDDGQPYLVMEYLQGFTVREVFMRATKEGGVPQDLAASIILGAARGLHAAHIAVDEKGAPMGLMHRDVSPHNLFVTETGVVKVLDFGIAKGVNELTMTRAGHVKGKASYLAPEQLDPNAKIDARADLFSLGTIAYEIFTGQRLFRRASETDTINAIRALQVRNPIEAKPDLDPEYASTVMRLLARRPNDRPQSAQEVVAALETALARRAPRLDGAELARYVSHIREIAPSDASRVSFAPPAPPRPYDRAARRKEIQEAFSDVPKSSRAPKPPEEHTATVAPPVEGAWISATGVPPPVDGSVVGTFAVAGATSSAVDTSGGYEALDPDDIVLEPSRAGPNPAAPLPDRAPPPVQTTLPGGQVLDRPAPPMFPPNPGVPSAFATAPAPMAAPPPPDPRPAPVPPSQETTVRRRGPGLVERIIEALESILGTRPTPTVIIAILACALVAGAIVAFTITSLLQ